MHLSPLNRLNLKLKYYQFWRPACQVSCNNIHPDFSLDHDVVQNCINGCVYEPLDEHYRLVRAAAPTSHDDYIYSLSPPRSPSPPHDKEKTETPLPKNTELVEDVRGASTFFLVSQWLTLELRLQRNVERGAVAAALRRSKFVIQSASKTQQSWSCGRWHIEVIRMLHPVIVTHRLYVATRRI